MFKNKDTEHQKIEALPYGSPTQVELLPNLDVHLKIEIPEGAANPIVLRFKRCDVNGDKMDGGVGGISFYGSYESRFPNINTAEYTLRNVSKVLIYDPTKGKDVKEFTENRKFYIMMQSGNPLTIHINIVSFVKVKAPPKKLPKKKDLEDE